MTLSGGTPARRSLSRSVALFAIAFILNWVWEAAQAAAYVETQGPLAFRVWHCVPMAVIDALWVVGLYLVTLTTLELGARRDSRVARYIGMAGLGALTATILETYAVSTRRWTYAPIMPILPVLQVGLWPLLQMLLLPVLAVWAAERYVRER